MFVVWVKEQLSQGVTRLYPPQKLDLQPRSPTVKRQTKRDLSVRLAEFFWWRESAK